MITRTAYQIQVLPGVDAKDDGPDEPIVVVIFDNVHGQAIFVFTPDEARAFADQLHTVAHAATPTNGKAKPAGRAKPAARKRS